jgi:hypothetical protein
MSFENDNPPTSKEEAAARSVRPPPEKYDPDTISHWSITMMVAWIIWRVIDAVRNEWDDYRNDCADWVWVPIARAKLVIPDLQKGLQKESPWHFHQWKPSGWSELRSRARSENPQVAIDLLWRAAGEDNIRATALECKNAKAFDGNLIEIPAHYWAHLKPDNDRASGKAILSGPDGRVYREVKFLRLDGKKLWPKSLPLSGEPIEHVKKPQQTRPAERELLGPKARPAPTTTPKRAHPQSERARRHIARLYPDGTNEISSEVIRKRLEKDPVLLAELATQGGKPPSRASIDRARGLRR